MHTRLCKIVFNSMFQRMPIIHFVELFIGVQRDVPLSVKNMLTPNFVEVVNIFRYDPIQFQTKIIEDYWLLAESYIRQIYAQIMSQFEEIRVTCTKGKNLILNGELVHKRKLFDEVHV